MKRLLRNNIYKGFRISSTNIYFRELKIMQSIKIITLQNVQFLKRHNLKVNLVLEEAEKVEIILSSDYWY